MRILVITQKVDEGDLILGFFHRWIDEFAKRVESVIVVCLQEGKHDLPENVKVYSLGKERGVSRAGYVIAFYRLIWSKRREYDAVFVHMNPEYAVLGGPFWKLLSKKISLWYVHRAVDLKLRIAALFSDVIFTSTPESFGIKSKKVRYVGHGIDAEKLKMPMPDFVQPLRLLHLGRITRIKHIETLMLALPLLAERGIAAILMLAGESVTPDDNFYKQELLKIIKDKNLDDRVQWLGSLPVRTALEGIQISVNGAPDGGMDKAVLESLAAQRPVFVANKAFKQVLGEYWDYLSYSFSSAEELAGKISLFTTLSQGEKENLLHRLEEKVRVEYDVRTLINRIVTTING